MIEQRKQAAAGAAVPGALWWEEEMMMDQTPNELQSYCEALLRLKIEVERRIINLPCSYKSLMDENYMNNM